MKISNTQLMAFLHSFASEDFVIAGGFIRDYVHHRKQSDVDIYTHSARLMRDMYEYMVVNNSVGEAFMIHFKQPRLLLSQHRGTLVNKDTPVTLAKEYTRNRIGEQFAGIAQGTIDGIKVQVMLLEDTQQSYVEFVQEHFDCDLSMYIGRITNYADTSIIHTYHGTLNPYLKILKFKDGVSARYVNKLASKYPDRHIVGLPHYLLDHLKLATVYQYLALVVDIVGPVKKTRNSCATALEILNVIKHEDERAANVLNVLLQLVV